jgi:hypothetical protein
MTIDGSGRVGIGTTSPETELHVISQTIGPALRNLLIDYYTNDENAALITARKARGTPASPLAVQSGDNILSVSPMGYDGSAFVNPARIRFTVDGPVTNNSIPTAIQILTGANTFGVERLRVTSSGRVGIGTSAPVAQLHVVGDVQFDGIVTGTYIKAHFQDVAEWVPSNDDLAPGTVVVLDASVGNGVMASSRPYDTSVAGGSPRSRASFWRGGFLKRADRHDWRVRVSGRVTRCLAVGDLSRHQRQSGYAMRSGADGHRRTEVPSARHDHRKAIEPLSEGQGRSLSSSRRNNARIICQEVPSDWKVHLRHSRIHSRRDRCRQPCRGTTHYVHAHRSHGRRNPTRRGRHLVRAQCGELCRITECVAGGPRSQG